MSGVIEDGGGGALDSLLLYRFPRKWLDLVATVTTALLVFASRFVYLADGPWEWDETLFARGILHFELAAHFPHPPGFPGWLAIGHLLMPMTRDPLLALQMASAAFSVVALWPLAALGRKVAPPPIAVAASLVVLAAPGPWLFAVRGFSTTAAAVLALGAAAIVADGMKGGRLTTFTLLVSASFLVRPILLPALVVLWLGSVWGVRPLRRVLPGLAVGGAAVVVSVAAMARAEGGWAAFVAPFVAHSERHFSRLVDNLGGFPELGLVKGLGGTAPASVVLALAVLGIVVWGRRVSWRAAILWALVLTVAVAQLIWLQNRTTARYAVGVQMALAPLVAGAAATLPPAAGCAGLLALAGWFGATSQPLVEEQHTTQLPAWRAVLQAQERAARSGRTVVVESELHPFASYLWHLLEWRGQTTPPKVLSPWDPEVPWPGIDGRWLVATIHRHFYPDGLRGRQEYWGGVSAELEPLTQQRFLEAWVIEDPPLPLTGWWPRERTPEGRYFMWSAPGAELLLPPLDRGTELTMAVRPAPGAEPVNLLLNGKAWATVEGRSDEQKVSRPLSLEETGRVSRFVVERRRGYPPGNGDSRALALQVFEVRALTPGAGWKASVVRPWQRQVSHIELEGAHHAESFGVHGMGVWLGPHAVLRLPAGAGAIRLRLWAPRPTPPRTVVRVAGRHAAGPLEIAPKPAKYVVDVQPGDAVDGRLEIEIISESFVPANHGSGDTRKLGVVLSEVEFVPRRGDLDVRFGAF
jgi:hypothetical protein